MPKKKSIQTSSPSDFEPKRKNPISLGSDSNIDKDFKPLKIGGKSTGLEFADGKILSSAEEFVTLKERTEELQVSIIKGNKSAGFYTPQFIMQSKDATSPDAGLWFNIFTSGNTFIKAEGSAVTTLTLEAPGAIYSIVEDDAANAFIWMKGEFASGSTPDSVAILQSSGQLKLIENSSAIASTAGFGQIWIKNETPNELYFTNDAGNNIQLTSGSSAAGGGASALNDLSDVTYSSGDLTISSLDKIITSGDLTLECGGDITLDADGGDISIIDSSPSAAKPSFSITSTDSGGFGIFQSYYHNSSSPYQTDYLTYKSYTGKNDAGQDVIYFSDLYNPWSVVDGAEIGRYVKSIMANGTLSTGLQLTGQTDGSVDVLLGNGDGDVTIKSSLIITEKASANGDVGASGQLWVKNDTPNNLYFTDDTGQDVAITNNGSLAGGGSNFITNDADDTMAGTLTIDKDSTGTTTATTKALVIDFDQTGISASGQTVTSQGLAISVNDNSVTHVGTHIVTGISNNVISNNSGTSTAYGILNNLNDPGGDVADTSIGIQQTVPDGGIDIKLLSTADMGDYFSIATTTHGATTITTFDDDATAANLLFDIDGDITLDAHGKNVYIAYNGTSIYDFDINNQSLKFMDSGDTGDYFQIAVATHGATTISTVDDDATAAHLTLDADGDITLDAASGNIYVKDNGGNYTPGSDYEIATKKYVDDNAGGGGASALNDLSDVTYSSGDLTISSLDKIISGALTFDMSGNIVFDFGSAGYDLFQIKADSSANAITMGGENGNYSVITMFEEGGTSTDDFFRIFVEASGATEITTEDNVGAGGHLKIQPDGNLTLSPISGIMKFYDGNNASDYSQFSVDTNGSLTVATVNPDAAAHLILAPDGQLKLNKPPRVKEQASADANTAAYGQLWVKNDTPNNLYFTNDAGNDVQITNGSSLAGGSGGSSNYHIGQGGRGRCQYNNWYGSNTAYGFAYYFWFQSTGSASVPTSWSDDRHPNHIVPYAGTITGYTIIGNNSTGDTVEWALLKGTGVTHGSAGNYTLSQVGASQSAGGTANIQYKWEQTGLSVSVAKNDILMLFFRRTTDNDSSYMYTEFTYNILIEAS